MNGRVCMVTPYAPSRFKLRPYWYARGLRACGWDVTLLAFHFSQAPFGAAIEADLAQMRAEGIDVRVIRVRRLMPMLRALSVIRPGTSTPARVAYCREPAIARALADLLRAKPFDVVHFDRERLAWAADIAAAAGVGSVVDLTDALSARHLQDAAGSRNPLVATLKRAEGNRLRRWEVAATFGSALCTVASDRDRAAVVAAGGDEARCIVVPNGVDRGAFRPAAVPVDAGTLCFVGNMDYAPNVETAAFLAEQVLPRVRAAVPGARLWLVGANPVASVRRLGGLEGVTVTGEVPDTADWVRRAELAVAPISVGMGFQNKVAEALVMGKATVVTPEAAGGMPEDVRPALEVVPRERFAEAVAALLRDPARRTLMEERALRLTREGLTWADACHRLVMVYERASNGRTLPAGAEERGTRGVASSRFLRETVRPGNPGG